MRMRCRSRHLLGALVMLCPPVVDAASTVVHPTGDPAYDVAAVRAAVRAGGTVLLKARDAAGVPRAFDFGEYPVGEIEWDENGSGYVALGTSGEIVPVSLGDFSLYVSLGNDVRLLGETRQGAMTTIRGGTIPIRNFEPRELPGVGEQVIFGLGSMTVQGIRFTESALQSIYTTQLSPIPEIVALLRERRLNPRIEIGGNEFIDVQPAFGGIWYALAAVTNGPAGRVNVGDNLVRFTSGRWNEEERAYEQANGLDPAPEIWEGISIANLHDAGEIARNRVQGVDVGLLVYFEGSDFVRLADNRVELRPEGLFGILCRANHRYLVEGNTVIARGSSPDGIVLWATDRAAGINGSTVRGNRVVMDGSEWGSISLVGAGSLNFFAGNQVEGSAAYVLGLVSDTPDGAATTNFFVGNQLSGFTPRDSSVYGTGVHVFFDTHTRRNVFIGESGTVKDLGQENVFLPSNGFAAGALDQGTVGTFRDLDADDLGQLYEFAGRSVVAGCGTGNDCPAARGRREQPRIRPWASMSAIHRASLTSVLHPGTFPMCVALARTSSNEDSRTCQTGFQ